MDVSFGKQDLLKRQNLEFLRDSYKYDELSKNKLIKGKFLHQSKSERVLNDFNGISKNGDNVK